MDAISASGGNIQQLQQQLQTALVHQAEGHVTPASVSHIELTKNMIEFETKVFTETVESAVATQAALIDLLV